MFSLKQATPFFSHFCGHAYVHIANLSVECPPQAHDSVIFNHRLLSQHYAWPPCMAYWLYILQKLKSPELSPNLKNVYTNRTRHVCTQLNAFFMLNPIMVMKIPNKNFFWENLTYLARMERGNINICPNTYAYLAHFMELCLS